MKPGECIVRLKQLTLNCSRLIGFYENETQFELHIFIDGMQLPIVVSFENDQGEPDEVLYHEAIKLLDEALRLRIA